MISSKSFQVLSILFVCGSAQLLRASTGIDGIAVSTSGFTLTGQVTLGTVTINTSLVVPNASTSNQAVAYGQLSPLFKYRRPVLQFASVTTVSVESGIVTGTSGDVSVLFPDGTLLTVNSTNQTTFSITRNAVLSMSGGAQSGLRSGISEATNTWYELYAAKLTDSSTSFVVVGDTTLPLPANYSTLNSRYGTNAWVPLGLIRNGDNSGSTGDILTFVMSGNMTLFGNNCVGNVLNAVGTRLASATGVNSVTYTYSSGTGTTEIPNTISIGRITTMVRADTKRIAVGTGINNQLLWADGDSTTQSSGTSVWAPVAQGFIVGTQTGSNGDINLSGFIDNTLGVGSNPFF
jgi:hypothetical protein